MPRSTVVNELTVEQSVSIANPYQDLAQLSFPSRYQMLRAALPLNAQDPYSAIGLQHSTVVTNAITEESTNT